MLSDKAKDREKGRCSKHGSKHWIESIPYGYGYCHQCAKDDYAVAPRCPHCGTKIGYAPGTGDCGCDPDPC